MRIKFLVSTILLGLTAAALPAAEHWSQFRGPGGDGQVRSDALPIEWSETQRVTWKTPIPGRAWSSPVVWENRIWMTSATPDGKRRLALCVDADSGKVLQDITVYEIAEPMFCYPFTPAPRRLWKQAGCGCIIGSAGTASLDTAPVPDRTLKHRGGGRTPRWGQR